MFVLLRDLGPSGGGRGRAPEPNTSIDDDHAGPSIFTAIQQKWGLRLESQKAPVDVIVLDHVERPTEN
jgi:uncharacterized protein (TIGR03435 family)